MASSTLYPPILPTYQSAFVAGNNCDIYFSLSQYNSYKEVSKNVQVTVVDQNTNLSMLKSSEYPNGIKICKEDDLVFDPDRDYDQYYITIKTSDLAASSGFEINRYYKVQIRFTDSSLSAPEKGQESNWLNDNTNYFSEWSTVCLIRPISKPSLTLKNFDEDESVVLTTTDVDIIGTLKFSNSEETDTLSSYRIKLYNRYTDDLLSDSGILYTNSYSNINEINYTFKYSFQDGESYRLVIDIETKNYYQDSFSYNFTIIEQKLNPLDVTTEIIADNGNGRVQLNLASAVALISNIIIRRTSSRSNFTIWEDICKCSLSIDKDTSFSWYDYTIESGVFYQYGVQKVDSQGNRGELKKTNKIMPVFYDMFLNADGQQLAIKCDQSISSFKHNIPDNKTDTLGSKYPFIRRNGDTDYKSFSLSGMITSFNDTSNIFFSEKEAYGTSVDNYQSYNEEEGTSPWNDPIYEREYRNKVLDFLNANTIKLLRTGTEGNILVRLMNVSLSPEETLGRMLYSFSADAYEIAECTIENYDSYGIQPVGALSSTIKNSISVQGQIAGIYKDNIFLEIASNYEKRSTNNIDVSVESLSAIRITFDGDAYVITETSDGRLTTWDGEVNTIDEIVAHGYIVVINNIDILVTGHTYQLTDSLAGITAISFPVETEATIDYVAELAEQEAKTQEVKVYSYDNINGQISGTFAVNENCYEKIWSKYYQQHEKYYRELLAINSLRIEADENTVVYIKTSENDDYIKYIINDTNILNIEDDETTITAFYFGGIQLEDGSINEISVDALVDYNCDLVRGDYA